MFTGEEIEATLAEIGFTHVVWVPDSTFGPWETALVASSRVMLVRVCREGEAWPLAAGLLLGGQSPLVVMQTTGLYESGDALRNVLFDMRLPILSLIGVRNWLTAGSRDTAKTFAEPIVRAWGLDCDWLLTPDDKPKLAAHYRRCRLAKCAGTVLLAEGA
jgi:hypothetical protein